MKLVLGALGVLVALSSGCAGSGGDQSDTEPAGQCQLLEAATVSDLAGEALEGRESTVGGVGGSSLRACMYGRLDDVGVQVAQAPAGEWARALPGMLDQLKDMGGAGFPDALRQIEEAAQLIERGEAVPPEQACQLFDDMLAFRGIDSSSDGVISYVPDREDPLFASVQTCRDGTYTSIGVARPGMTAGAEQDAALEEAINTLR